MLPGHCFHHEDALWMKRSRTSGTFGEYMYHLNRCQGLIGDTLIIRGLGNIRFGLRQGTLNQGRLPPLMNLSVAWKGGSGICRTFTADCLGSIEDKAKGNICIIVLRRGLLPTYPIT